MATTKRWHESLLAAALGAALLWGTSARSQPVDFDGQIKPLLSDRCYKCHGPDRDARRAALRLDRREDALSTKRGDVALISPGDPAGSLLLQRVTSTNLDQRMPPVDSKLRLSDTEIELLRRWIQEGAEWTEHWSLVPMNDVIDVPVVSQERWVGNAIDRFVLARLEREGLSLSPPASRGQLIRRLSFDLTGLPPTVAEIEQFVDDDSPVAYAKLVDRLLASAAFGENLAVDWLDVARYADTHGYQSDVYRSTWPWRDWVVDAFNRDLPYDDFITWQLAGDLLPERTREQRLATAFNRHHRQTNEGGSVEEEFRVAYVVDRVNTMGAALMGLTLECARCHNHKFDPISQKEYYQLFAFFNNIDESGLTSHFTDSVPVPTLLLPEVKAERELLAALARLGEVEAAWHAARERAADRFEAWRMQNRGPLLLGGLVGHYPLDSIEENKTANQASEAKPGVMVETPRVVSGVVGKAFLLDGENGVRCEGVGAFTRNDPFTLSLWVRWEESTKRAVLLHRTRASTDAGSRGYEVLLEDGHLSFALIHMWPQNSMKVTTAQPFPLGEWVHVSLAYDGSSRASGLHVYLNGQESRLNVVRDNLFKNIVYERTAVELTVGKRFRDSGFKNGTIDELRVFDRLLSPLEVLFLAERKEAVRLFVAAGGPLESRERALLLDYYVNVVDEEVRQARAELHAARTRRSEVIDPIPEIMVMAEMSGRRPAYVLTRGAYDAPGEEVERGTPARVLEFQDDLPRNRLGLARWLLDPQHPLTARVTVNRYWQFIFGRGIVETAEDFGSQGARPTHPGLLDWLAREFIRSGWDVKRSIRLMVMSSTYRQKSRPSKDLLAKDPSNQLLARGPRYRLTAERIRDNALTASGLLVRAMGGPSVKPYQPAGLWKEKSGKEYVPDKGPGLYRRSLYTFWKRTSPPPAMITFDAAERNQCVLRRQATSTPLQALVLLNDPQYVEAARQVAARMLNEAGPELDERLTFGFLLLTSRSPSMAELSVLRNGYREQLAHFSVNPDAAEEFLSVGEARTEVTGVDRASWAAMSVVASTLMNIDEAVMKR